MDYRKKRKIIIVLFFVLFLSIFLFFEIKNNLNQKEEIKKIVINEKIINIELAKSPLEHYVGLSGREEVCDNCGLLFIFPDLETRQFVMRNMKFPLDIIFIKDDTIVEILENLEPEGSNPKEIYSSNQPVNNVLEINAGMSKQYDFKTGQKVIFK
jgi:uncharacterized membrane protein (UPF0127 family)